MRGKRGLGSSISPVVFSPCSQSRYYGRLLYLKKFRPSGLFAMAAGRAAVVMLILRFLV